MKARLALAAVLLVLTVLILWHANHSAPPPPPPTPATVREPTTSPDAVAVPPATPPSPAAPVIPAVPAEFLPAAPPVDNPLPPPTVAVEMETVKMLIRDFRASLGGNPVGSNAEITQALQGANPRRTRFLAGGEGPVNSKGELIDHWGTPYFFHQISGHEMEIRSAGPDRKMWTDDDLVVR